MDSITFKNFRQFKDETTFELNNINILVGKNNSGKSTLTKGLRLYLYNIKNLKFDNTDITESLDEFENIDRRYRPFFLFGGDALDNPHVGTFGRAFSRESKDDYILFSVRFNHIVIETIVSRFYQDDNGNQIDCFDKTSAPISCITICDEKMASRYVFDFLNNTQIIEIDAKENSACYKTWEEDIREIQSNPDLYKKHRSGIEWYSSPKDKERVNTLKNYLAITHKELIKLKMSLLRTQFDGYLYSALFDSALQNYLDPLDNENEQGKSLLLDELEIGSTDSCEEFAFLSEVFGRTNDEIRHIIELARIEYIEAHSVTHSIVYNSSDKNDYMAQTILKYLNENIKADDPEKAFIEDWMMKFEIGEDFEIESIGGECFKLGIIEDVDHPEEFTPLLDKGVGSNQMMILLLRLAIIMHKNRAAHFPPLVIIEEPEQNLHPQMQSLLAELFNEVHTFSKEKNKRSRGVSFIIETHSEYIVRRVQRIVAEKMYGEEKELIEDNPFKVIYCPRKEKPFDMGWNIYGRFNNYFDEGFFDVASNDALAVSKLERSRR